MAGFPPPNVRLKATGELAGSASAAQMPSIPAKYAKFKAVKGNVGEVLIGVAGVTAVDGTTDTTSGWELVAQEETPWLPCDNLSDFYYISDNAGDDLVYMILR